MPAPSPMPQYVYKIPPEAPPSPLPRALPLSDLDAKDGFIHLSTAEQTPDTAGRFYSTANTLWLLKIPLKDIESGVKWEQTSSGCFAHLYGNDLGSGEVEEAKECNRSGGETWTDVLGEDSWLIKI